MSLLNLIAAFFKTLQSSELRDSRTFFEIVGESNYQKNLMRIAGPKTSEGKKLDTVALLIPEVKNSHDSNAVRVTIGGVKVGYLARSHALEYRKYLGSKIGRCPARIVGGWKYEDDDFEGQNEGSFGVRLKLFWPPMLKSSFHQNLN